MNVPRTIAALVPDYGTLRDFQTVYGVEDLYDMMEIAAVRVHNQVEAQAEANRKARQA